MDELALWQQKLLQLLHDPPAKPFAMVPGKNGAASGGHKTVANTIASTLTGVDIRYFRGLPDYAMAGADRPVFPGGRGAKERVQVRWPDFPLITHPLSPGYRLLLGSGSVGSPTAGAGIRGQVLADQKETVQSLALRPPEKNKDEYRPFEDGDVDPESTSIDPEDSKQPVWNNLEALKTTFLIVWRKLRHQLTLKGPGGDDDPLFRLLWQTMPADGRCPDHTIWEHNRLTSALAFMTEAKSDDAPRAPWLFRFEIGPVGRFIEESRTSRDLWISSFLLADMIWHAMKPVVERYGPDCIIYPDLRANPRVDVWLKKEHAAALPGALETPATYAAVLPNAFTAVVPLGSDGKSGCLVELKRLARKAEESMQKRWQELADIVEPWLLDIQGAGPGGSAEWQAIWKRQHERVLTSTWSAIRWSRMKQIYHFENLTLTNPLPCQEDKVAKGTENERKSDQEAIRDREERLKPFVPTEVWAHYNHARAVFARTNLPIHQMERGFDYALTHHQLRERHALRKQQSAEAGVSGEAGEKCTVCGRRQALYNLGNRPDKLHGHRRAARDFWEAGEGDKKRLNPDPVQQDRLCGVCAMKRFLVEAGVDRGTDRLIGINEVWAGQGKTVQDLKFNDDKPRVPFPSTAMVAAQHFIEAVCEEPKLAAERADVVRRYREADLPRTGFARSLSRLAALERNSSAAPFLMLDPQQSIFPETLDILIRQAKTPAQRDALDALKKSVANLRRKASEQKIAEPGTGIAVIRFDGDEMGRLLLGDPKVLRTTWRDIIHPEAVFSHKRSSLLTAEKTKKAGWPDLLDCKRLMGPSLHAFISRCLAEFSHRIVPWVVEREFSGRLIYCGGDDILAMAPARDALPMAARLQQLFSAPYIIDTRSGETAWGWRNPDSTIEHDESLARRRFIIPARPADRTAPITLPLASADDLEEYSYTRERVVPDDLDGELLTMLGKGYSLSAGIAYGHFKSPLQGLLRQSKRMLEEWAKGIAGRSAVGLSHFSRNGIKTEFAMQWGAGDGFFATISQFQKVIAGFADNSLPGRLPYKLREHHQLLNELRDQDGGHRETLVTGLFAEAYGRSPKKWDESAKAAFSIWREGMRSGEAAGGDPLARAADGLLIARKLASKEEEA